MFSGRTGLNVDSKGRLAIPTRYREDLNDACGGRVVITQHPYDNTCLVLYPFPAWRDITRQVGSLSDSDPNVRTLKRRFVGQAVELEMDGSGRLLIPQELRDLIGLEKRAMLIGQMHRFELWTEEAWEREHGQEVVIDVDALPDDVKQLSF